MLHAGWTAQSAVSAALFARAGLDGPATVLEGPYGVFHSHFRLPGDAVLPALADLGTRWASLDTSIKPYPVCYMSISPLAAVRTAVADRTIRPEDVREVRVSIPQPGHPIVLEPRAAKLRPRTRYEAQFSLPFALAAMLVTGRVDLATFEEPALSDRRVLDLASRVVGVPADFPTFPASCPASVEVELLDGTLLAARLEHEPGGPGDPLPHDAVLAKFRANAGLLLPPDVVADLEDRVLHLEAQADLDGIAAALTGAPVAAATPAPSLPASDG
jgi:2-methylcitrate dehydratase PrpD